MLWSKALPSANTITSDILEHLSHDERTASLGAVLRFKAAVHRLLKTDVII